MTVVGTGFAVYLPAKGLTIGYSKIKQEAKMFNKNFLKGSIIIAVCTMVIGSSVQGFCQPNHPRDRRPVVRHPPPPRGKVVVRHPVPRYGRVVVNLPANHRKIVVKRQNYFFHHGVFYRQGPGGYVVVRAPIGAIVATIPVGFLTFVVGNNAYFYYGGIYYRQVPSGYMVVESPPETVVVQESSDEFEVTPAVGDQVSVTAALLNVRSGPNENHPVIAQVSNGTVMVVRGHAPGWLYVEFRNGAFGWIMAGYTARLPQPANG
jgi:hypothetical protein